MKTLILKTLLRIVLVSLLTVPAYPVYAVSLQGNYSDIGYGATPVTAPFDLYATISSAAGLNDDDLDNIRGGQTLFAIHTGPTIQSHNRIILWDEVEKITVQESAR